MKVDREEAKKEDEFSLSNEFEDEDEEDWEGDNDWNNEADEAQDVKDESAAYLEFLNEEVSSYKVREALRYLILARPKNSRL